MYKNTFYNILGMLIPGVISIPAMGLLARSLDVELFGILILSFSILGYSGVFDAGITRAVIRKIAMQDNIDLERSIMGTALVSVFILSIIASFIIYFNAENISYLLKVTPAAFIDVRHSIQYLSFSIPFFLVGTVAFAYLEGKQMFLELNKYKVFTGTLISLLPVAFSLVYSSLTYAIVGLLLARIITMILALYSCYRHLGKRFFCFEFDVFKDLITFGSWITLSNIISPLMVYADRFILSNLLGADKVAYFAAPNDLVQKISFIPGALAKTIFPFFSQNSDGSLEVERKAYFSLVIVLLFILIPLFMFSDGILTLWLGRDYGVNSGDILRILIVGFFFNSLAQIPFSKIQALGKSKVTAYIHLIEIIPYFLTLYILIHFFGFIGAAIAWSLRVMLDFILLESYSRKFR